MAELTVGVVGTSNMENEHRRPIHPAHLAKIDPELRKRMTFERGYGERFHVSDEVLATQVGGLASRDELFARSDCILLPKPTEGDFASFREGQILWGWPHCVQGPKVTQVGIDKRLTMIAWEAMFHWNGEVRALHTFARNNELAGYCSVVHACQIQGITGIFGAPRRAAVIGFGATARGAIMALQGLGFREIHCFTERPNHLVANQIPGVHFQENQTRKGHLSRDERAKLLGTFDVIVNCVLQDTDDPITFIYENTLRHLRPGTLIVDVSCDTAMGFEWAVPTSFAAPAFTVGNGVLYYAVDHTPSYLWEVSTWEISKSLLPYLPVVMAGPDAWAADPTIARAIEIHNGVIQNPKILSFQNRAPEWPHSPR